VIPTADRHFAAFSTSAAAWMLAACAMCGCSSPTAPSDATATSTNTAADTAAPPGRPKRHPRLVPTPIVQQPVANPLPSSPELLAKISTTFGERCRLKAACGDLLGIDCDSAADGPYYYVNATTLEKVSTCGGACMGGRCTNCPPKEWTCK